jgi:hypothetical protein
MQRRTLGGVAAALVVASLAGWWAPRATGADETESGPSFVTYYGPPTTASIDDKRGGEPSIGVDWATGAVMYQHFPTTLRVHFDDTHSPAQATWTVVYNPPTSRLSQDPILFTDHHTNRTFVSQLDLACSLMAFSDNDGASWTPSEGCGLPAGFDHQTVGGGPYARDEVGAGLLYGDAVYYCAQEEITALCARSDDGGLTFGASVPIYSPTQCQGAHGHVKVAEDGTVYVPLKFCPGISLGTAGRQGVAVSSDDGLTWTVRTVPDSSSLQLSDPSVGIGAAGTVYFGYQAADGHARVAVSHDRGLSWTRSFDVGAQLGIQNVEFPAVVAGDDDRAAYAFLGTTAPGNDQAAGFQAIWHLYVSYTVDGGSHWQTVDATPTSPVQKGCIWLSGGRNPCRNLADFMDATVDAQGRVLVGYDTGCVGGCVTSPSLTTTGSGSTATVASIARQTGGPRLYRHARAG